MKVGKVVIYIVWCTLGLVRPTVGFQCSTCARDGTCETIRGILSVTVMSKGYNPVVIIPRGACNVNVTEAAESSNHLALKDSDYSYVFNGHWFINDPGPYTAAGTRFLYRRTEPGCPGECVYAEGPLLQNVTVQLLYHDRSPGIFYTFQIPLHLKNEGQVHYPFPQPADYYGNRQSELRERPSEVRQHGSGSNARYEATTPRPSVPVMAPYPDSQYIRRKEPIFTSDFSHVRQRNQQANQNTVNRENPSPLGERQALSGVTYSRTIDDNLVSVEKRYPTDDSSESFDLHNELTEESESIDSKEDSNLDYFDYILKSGGEDNTIVNIAEKFSWHVAGLTECSRICGGGIQQTKYECVEVSTNLTVDQSNCQTVIKPEVQHYVCNTEACTPSWSVGIWSPCSATCGRGYQRRNVTCTQRVSATSELEMESLYCNSESPAREKDCFAANCYAWHAADWSECDVKCGNGTKTRTVTCKDSTGSVVSDGYCDVTKPPSDMACEGDACSRDWFFTRWNDQCSVECGEGVVSRTVRCLTGAGRPLADNMCDEADRPPSNKRCHQGGTCAGTWFTGPWSKCSQTCGDGARTRYVLCMKTMGDNQVMAPDYQCLQDAKPETSDRCRETECGHMWFMTDWSECSRTCGGGIQTRTAQCYDGHMRPSGQCNVSDRPDTRQACNQESCRETPPPQASTNGRCRDKFPNCRIVVQARLCRYHYYQRKCCDSCSDNVYTNVRG